MIRRLAIVLLVLLAACGDDDGAGADGGIDVSVAFDEPLRVGPVTWEVTITNDTGERLELEFSSGQRADVTLTRDGEEIYRWSRGVMFTQELGTVTLPPDGGTETFTLDEPGLDVDSGEYTLTAIVTASDRDLSVERQVTVEPMRR